MNTFVFIATTIHILDMRRETAEQDDARARTPIYSRPFVNMLQARFQTVSHVCVSLAGGFIEHFRAFGLRASRLQSLMLAVHDRLR